MLNDRLNQLGDYPFRRLAALLEPIALPAGVAPLSLAVGDPQMGPPGWVADEIARHAHLWGRYPALAGSPELRAAIADWCTGRFGLPPGMIDPALHVLPVPGTREGLLAIALAVVPARRPDGRQPAVLMPNPLYHVYAAAAALAGGEPVLLDAGPRTGFLPDLDTLDPALLDRCALFYLCTPGNPQGAVADRAYLARLVGLARTHGFVLALDECYAEIYDRLPPPGGLEICAASGALDQVVVFHSLSKRSSAPGLRSGFLAGDATVIAAVRRIVEYGGAGISGPVMAASVRLWRDEAHVETVRDFYRVNFALADRILAGRFEYQRPAGGFCLWLNVGDGEAAARRLWGQAGLRVLPGAYMCRGGDPAVGHPYIRVALVHPPDVTEPALTQIAKVL